METSQKTRLGFYYGYFIVIASSLIMVGALGIHYAFGVFFKPLLDEFGWSRAVISGAVSLSWIVQGVSSIAMGALNDRYNPRLVVSVCGFFLGSGYFLMSQIDGLWQIYLIYGVLVGGGLGGIYVPLTSTVARWFKLRRSIMTGIVVTGIGIGTTIAPILANWLIAVYDWRISYKILGIAVTVIVVIAAQFLKREPAAGQMPLSESPRVETSAGGMLFKDAFRTRQFWMIFFLFLCFGICLYVVLVHIVPFAIDINIDPANAAGLLATIGVTSIFAKVIFGKVGDKIGSRSVYLICFSIMAFSFVLLILAKGNWILFLFAVIFGAAYAGCSVSQSPLIASFFGLRAHGTLLGGANCGYTLGAAIGPFMAGYIFDTNSSYHWAFVLSAIIAFIGLVFTLALGSKRGFEAVSQD